MVGESGLNLNLERGLFFILPSEKDMSIRPFQILLVEDGPGDFELVKTALENSGLKFSLDLVKEGTDVMAFLNRHEPYTDAQRPDLILIDLRFRNGVGDQTLKEIKSSHSLKIIPVIIISDSTRVEDVVISYNLGANCYITRPVDQAEFLKLIEIIMKFWLTMVKLPTRAR
jgi:DNA-binding response OmpR family regulator